MSMGRLFNLRTVRKKLLLLTKLAGIALILSYALAVRLPLNPDLSFALWMALVVLLILLVDGLMGHFISKPIAALNQTARQMAGLDFSSPCRVTTSDEFGELSASLNKMADNLQQSLAQLAAANGQLEDDLRQKQRLLAERKALVNSLSHEMKTPLGIIRSYAEGLLDETDTAQKQRYAEVIISETERMNHLLMTLLDLSALESGAIVLNQERFDFVELLETAAGRLLMDIPNAGFQLRYTLPEHQVFVQADKDRLEQVLDNLIVNARHNVRPGGIIDLSLVVRDGQLHFAVANQGKPIPPEHLDKIWTKFYRDSTVAYSGSGLGLAIVAQILTLHQLAYGAENLADGVRFYFSIPVAP